jgi:hypothetical protein
MKEFSKKLTFVLIKKKPSKKLAFMWGFTLGHKDWYTPKTC